MAAYRIAAIDPGPARSAMVIWDGAVIRARELLPSDELVAVLPTLATGCDAVAIEVLQCFGMAVGAETFETAYIIGRLMERSPLPVQRVRRSDVKMHHCHSTRARDSNIRQALIDRFGPPGTKRSPGLLYGLKADLWSAMAIAAYAHDCQGRAGGCDTGGGAFPPLP